MKNLIAIFILFSLSTKAQNFKALGNITIKSKGEKRTKSLDGSPNIEKGKDIGSVKTEIVTYNSNSENVVYREMKISNELDKVLIQLDIKRISQKKGDFFDIDTDSPFVSDERNKRITDHYLQFIEQPLKMTLNLKIDSLVMQNSKLPILGQWNLDMPKLNKIVAFSGIFLEPKSFGKQSWNDTLFHGKSTYYNSYKIINTANHFFEIEISGFAKSATVTASNNEINPSTKIPSVGEIVNAETSNLAEKYFGNCLVDIESGLISSLNLEVEKNEVVKAMGQDIEKTTLSNFKISNKKN